MPRQEEQAILNFIELWKAIHGGCWPPGPGDPTRLTEFAREILQSLSLLAISRTISDKQLAKGLSAYAIGQFNSAAKTVGSFGIGA